MSSSHSTVPADVLYDILGRMIKVEPLATDFLGARYYYDQEGSILFVYGTDPGDLRDWKCNLNLDGAVFGGGDFELSKGSRQYAEEVSAGVYSELYDLDIVHDTEEPEIELVVGHSLGASAVPWLCAEYGCGGLMVGAPRNVKVLDGSVLDWAEMEIEDPPILDLTHPHDPVTQLVPWRERLPYWVAARVRLPGHWTGALRLPLTLLAAALGALVVPFAGTGAMTWLASKAFRAALKPHHLESYRASLLAVMEKEKKQMQKKMRKNEPTPAEKLTLKALYLSGGTATAGEVAGIDRHRMRNLQKKGLVKEVGTQGSIVGKPITVWGLTDLGRKASEGLA